MRPLAPAWLALLVLLPLAAPALAQDTPGITGAGTPIASIPTQQNLMLGPLNITLWTYRDTRTLVFSPTETNPLAIIWNYNFTAGSLGLVYVRAQPAAGDNNSYDFAAQLNGPGDQVSIDNATFVKNITPPLRPTADNAFQFSVGGAAMPGPLRLTLDLQAFDNHTGHPEQIAAQRVNLDLTIIDPFPPFAVRKDIGGTTVFGWVAGGAALARGGTGCLGGASAYRSDAVPQGSLGIACLLAVTHSKDKLQLNA
ncbi:MAG: hypothetical protein LC624_12725, partial [Halobacteriales archaeon]|nr:hypothetical protein [Halobacteriales archaeon]